MHPLPDPLGPLKTQYNLLKPLLGPPDIGLRDLWLSGSYHPRCVVLDHQLWAVGASPMYDLCTHLTISPTEEQAATYVTLGADNSRGPGGPTGPLGTPFRTPATLSRPSITHRKPFWDPLILASGTFG